LKNGASASQWRKTGTYQRKEVFGKLPSWTSKNYAIWYNSKVKAWAIGTLSSLGTNSQGILGIKGQEISEAHFLALISSKNNNNNCFT
jgi:hypothetical protein